MEQDARLFEKDEFKGPHIYRYRLYDHRNRIIESGEWLMPKYNDDGQLQENERYLADDILLNATQVDYQSLLDLLGLDQTGERTEVIQTFYDQPQFTIPGFTQQNTRNRVASITREESHDGNGATYHHATHYSYDVHGNVNSLIQDQPALSTLGQQYKQIDYIYDLISGNVHEVRYQYGETDQMMHRYEYDADNRITNVYTSKNGFDWDQDAKYFYYLHGPRKRTETGDLKVQATDYAYTIHGWTKGVNSNTLTPDRDMGKDGISSHLNQYSGKDQVGFTLGYYDGDYNDIGGLATGDQFEADISSAQFMSEGESLYNGNINHMVTAIRSFMSGTASPNVMRYEYDQLNRLKTARSYTDNTVVGSNVWSSSGINSWDYAVDLSYDANGNIETLKRNATGASAPGQMDDLTYDYYDETDVGYNRKTNRLKQVADAVSAGSYTVDIDDQVTPGHTYDYDGIGNMTADPSEEIDSIKWNTYGRITEVIRETGSTKEDVEYLYDAMQNRVCKIVKPKDINGDLEPESEWIYTYLPENNLKLSHTASSEHCCLTRSYHLWHPLHPLTLPGT